MVLSQSQKQENSNFWKSRMSFVREGGVLIWEYEGHIYTKRGNKLVAPNKKAYIDMMKNTTQDFFTTYIVKN